MKNKQVKLYNVGFSPVFFYLFPTLFLISIPFNFLVDSIVLLILLKKNGLEIKYNYKRAIIKVFAFGYLADILGALLVLAASLISESFFESGRKDIANILSYVSVNAFYHPVTFIIECLIVAFSGWIIYILNLKFSFKKTNIDENKIKKISLWIAILTAPYLFFIPMFF